MIVLLAAATLLTARPMVLIYQERVLEFTNTDNNIMVDAQMAKGLDAVGKVVPIVWSMNEPHIAAAVKSGAIKDWTQTPSHGDVFKVARAIDAEYVAIVQVLRKGGELNANIDLFRNRGGRSVWDNKVTVSIIRDGKLDAESGGMSIASTWVAQLDTIPFKNLPAQPALPTPDPGAGQITPNTNVQVDKTPLENARKAEKEGHWDAAVSLYRDAVDANPTSPEPRHGLIGALRQGGHPFLAAEEAARAYELMPDRSEFLVDAARSWIDGGQPAKAFEKIQEALAKNPNDGAALAIFGDMLMGRLEFDRAVESYSKAIAAGPTGDLYFKRAQAYALSGQFDKSVADMDQANKLGSQADPAVALQRYRENVKVLAPVFESLDISIKNLLTDAKAGTNIKSGADKLAARITAFLAYLDKMQAPAMHSKSHEERGLALDLLMQATAALQRYSSEGGTGLGDADLLQIEAMREFATSTSSFEEEIKGSYSR
ncbi:MAG TPA: tetratricopeptide repeat protein [Fimbriimonadales bacterium]|jgi:tetratricopeptide (TPR) repeat protein|nr:tetratricopeptide repeat protein [Fimbriimonadales bacterium]